MYLEKIHKKLTVASSKKTVRGQGVVGEMANLPIITHIQDLIPCLMWTYYLKNGAYNELLVC